MKDRLVRAASSRGQTVSLFVRETVARRVDEVLAELHEITSVSAEYHDRLCSLLAAGGGGYSGVGSAASEPFAVHHNTQVLSSADPDQDGWLRTVQAVRWPEAAIRDERPFWFWMPPRGGDPEPAEGPTHRAARAWRGECFVWCSRGYDEVDGFYALTPHRIVPDGAAEREERAIAALRLSHFTLPRELSSPEQLSPFLRDVVGRAHRAGEARAAELLVWRRGVPALEAALIALGFWPVPGTEMLGLRLLPGPA